MGSQMKEPTRTETAMAAIRQRVAAAPGIRLPSLRGLAEQLKVSKSTVVEAYDRLVATGEVVAKPGSGFFAATRTRPFHLKDAGPQFDRAIDPLWIAHQSLASPAPALLPGSGWLPGDWLPGDMLRSSMRSISREQSANLTRYSTPKGFLPLREQLARRLNERGISADPGTMLLTDSATRAIDTICRFLLQPGDTVLIDDPCYFNFQSTLQAQRVHMVGIPYTESGPDLDRFAAACIEHRPKLYLTTAVLHNPTGASVSVGTAHRLLKLAEAHDLVLVEDGISADFDSRPMPGLAALDGLDRVIYVGSFSKTLSASLRCGFIVARHEWIEGLTNLTLATSFGTSDLSAQITCRLLTNGHYRRHLDALRPRLARAMATTTVQLEKLGLSLWTRPESGMFLWAKLPGELDSGDIAKRALEQGMMLAPGNVFSVSQSASHYLRFNVSQCVDKRVFDVLAKCMVSSSRRVV
jgi:DNA-binding transcriptional MocR family regulator